MGDNLEKKTQKLEKGLLRGAPLPSSFDEKNKTIEVVFAEGTRGLRQTWFGDYYEELSMEEGHVRMDRLKRGAPVLNSHNSWSLNSVIGVVEDAFLREGQGIARVRLSQTENDKDIVKKIQDGIIRNLSVGYMVYRYDVTEEKGQLPIYRATDWEPVEISFVAVPFDPNAQVRARAEAGKEPGTEFSECVLVTRKMEEIEMSKKDTGVVAESAQTKREGEEQPVPAQPETKVEVPAPAEAAAPTTAVTEEKKEVVEEPSKEAASLSQKPEIEQKRIREILAIARNSNLPEEEAWKLIERNLSVEDVAQEIKTRWAKEGSDVKVDNKIEVGSDKRREIFNSGISNAILHRSNPGVVKLTDEGREFRGMSIVEMAKDMMEAAGHRTRGMTKSEVAQKALSRSFWTRLGMNTTDDFPNILADVANKTLRSGYQEVPQTFRPFTRQVTAPDFKTINRMQFGEAPSLEEIGEHGEYTYGTIGDGKEVYQIKSYGKIFAFTRQMMVNDDLDALARVPQLFGAAGARVESDLVWAIFTANAAMGDGVALFHSTHGNLGSAGAISDTTLTEMRKLGRLQTGLDGVAKLNIVHKYLIVPAAKEVVAQKQLALIQPNASSSVNVFSGMYQLIVEPRLDDNSTTVWYAAASLDQIDMLEIAYLEGQENVRLESEIDFDTDGMKMKCAHDFGVKAIDWRGVFKNPSVS